MGQGTCIMAVGLSIWVLLLCTTFSVHVVKGEVGANCTGAANCSSPNETCGSNNVCACNSGYYQIDKECYKKPSYNGGCSQSIPCKDGLTCNNPDVSGQCKCPDETTHYWSGSSCVEKPSYNGVCSQSIPCGNGLTCNNPDSGGGQCKCPDETTHYWSGSSCVEKNGYNGSCSSSVPCGNDLTCNNPDGGSGQCKCPDETTHYWSGSSCVEKKQLGEGCTENNSIQCITEKSVCLNSKCQCDNTTFDNNGTDSIGGECKLKSELKVNISVTKQSTKMVEVTWDYPAMYTSVIRRYIVRWSLSDGKTFSNITNSNSYSIPQLTPGRKYTFVVDTVVDEGNIASNSVKETMNPSQPGNITSGSSFNSSALRIQWDQGEGYVQSYVVNNTAGLTPNPANPRNAFVAFQGATPGQTYTITVVAVAEDGETKSESRDLTFSVDPEMPSMPRNMIVYALGSRELSINWTQPSSTNGELTGYRIRVYKDKSTCAQEIILHFTGKTIAPSNTCPDVEPTSINSSTALNYHVTGLNPNTDYTITLAAVNTLDGHTDSKDIHTAEEAPPVPQEAPIMPPKEATDTSMFKINVDIAFFTDSSYGTIQDFGLLVCKDSCPSSDGRKDYKASDFVDKNKVPSWHQAKDDGLKFYRATGQAFMDLIRGSGSTRRRRKRSVTIKDYKIGEDGSCDGQAVYCNGELESGSSYYVIAFACTAAGCTEFSPIGPFATKANIIPIVVGVLIPVLLIIGIVIGVVVYKRRNSGNPRQKLNDIDLPDVHTSTIKTSRPVALKDFADYVASLHKDANLKFAQQYEDLKDASPKLSTAIANLDENKVKNRYVNILPFDESRVKLSPLDSENDDVSGYINANYMPGYTSEREYIACQGPLPGTIDDFWRMVWEKNVSICVMLTLVKEENKVKCETYWPTSMDECKQFGDIVVELQSESVVNTYVVRIFKMAVGDKVRTLKQFHFLTWKDFSANVTDDVIISFINNVRSHIQPPDMEGPMVVHCSAGVGRTGTYITIDYLIQFIDNHDFDAEVDIFKFIYEMRKRRMCMVQTEQQFIFIHDCAKVLIQRKYEKLEENVYENQAYNMDNLYENVSVNKDMRTEF